MENHARDLVAALIWLVGVLGSLGLGTIMWGIRAALQRMDNQDVALEDIRSLLASELQQLRNMHHSLDARVIRIETTCATVLRRSRSHDDELD